MTPEFAELRRLAEACPMQDDSDVYPWYTERELTDLNIATIDAAYIAAANPAVMLALLAAAAERDALAAKVAECEALMVELQPDPVLVGDSWIPFRDLAEVCGNFMRSSAEHAREAKALAAKVERVRALHFGEYVETIAELRRRHAALTPFALRFLGNGPGVDPYIALACEDGTPLPEPAFDAVLLFAELAAAEIPALLDAADERDALTVAQPCVMRLGEVYDFAWCETHDRTFALGSSCDHAGLSHVDYLDDDGRKQRGRAVRAEMEMERIAAERDALAAKVERLVAVHASYFDLDGRPGYDDTNPEPEDVWRFDRDFRAALDEGAQP